MVFGLRTVGGKSLLPHPPTLFAFKAHLVTFIILRQLHRVGYFPKVCHEGRLNMRNIPIPLILLAAFASQPTRRLNSGRQKKRVHTTRRRRQAKASNATTTHVLKPERLPPMPKIGWPCAEKE